MKFTWVNISKLDGVKSWHNNFYSHTSHSVKYPSLASRHIFYQSYTSITPGFTIQWCSQGLPGCASCPPGRPKWGRKWRKIEEKWEKLQENEERLRKSSYFAHPGVRGWLRPWLLCKDCKPTSTHQHGGESVCIKPANSDTPVCLPLRVHNWMYFAHRP